jgi:hypothetical protein
MNLGHEHIAMLKPIAVIAAALISITGLRGGAFAQALPSTPLFEGSTTTLAKNGTTQAVHVSIQSWAMNGGAPDKIPLRGFYVAHLLSGAISTTIGGKTTMRLPGSYWTVGAATIMQVKVVGETALLETIATAKQ